MPKTKPYTMDAVKRYNEKHDRLTVYAPQGTSERIKQATGLSVSAYINRLILEDLERLERLAKFNR